MRILLVEDDADLAEVVALGLRNETYAVDVARTYADAEDQLRTTDFDVACIDLGLPDGDGLDLVGPGHPQPAAEEARQTAAHRDDHERRLPAAGAVMTAASALSVFGPAWRSLRVRLAVLGFLAIYMPVLLLFGVTLATDEHETVETRDGVVTTDTATDRSAWPGWTVVALAPAAGALAWWWGGRAVRPIERVRAVAEDIEASDLGRRIGLDRGPTELVSLAASFDAMLDRLERSAHTQRQLIEETSHELRTPLSVLTTNADVLLADPNPTIDGYRRGLERAKAAAGPPPPPPHDPPL